jgi:hypothetical protein
MEATELCILQYFAIFASIRKEVMHTALYVVYSMKFDVLSKKIREQYVQKSMKCSRARNPQIPSLAS